MEIDNTIKYSNEVSKDKGKTDILKISRTSKCIVDFDKKRKF